MLQIHFFKKKKNFTLIILTLVFITPSSGALRLLAYIINKFTHLFKKSRSVFAAFGAFSHHAAEDDARVWCLRVRTV